MKHLLLMFVIVTVFFSTGFTSGHKYSEVKTKERMELKFILVKSSDKGVPAIPLLAAGASVLIQQGVVYLKEASKKEFAKYIASYGKKFAGKDLLNFIYQDLTKIQLTRFVTVDGSEEAASFVSLNLKKTDGGAFSFTLDDAWVRYAKCKIFYKENANKKIPYPQIDLTVKVSIQCYWRDSTGAPRSDALGTLEIPVRGVYLTGNGSGASRLDLCQAMCEGEPECENECVQRSEEERTIVHSWFPPLPVNFARPGQLDQMAFMLSFSVVEYDDYAEIVKKHGALLGNASDVAGAMSQKLLELLTTTQ
nr:hypothetical protein [uncultured Pseudodesulfovibrio sp.]